MSKLTLRYPRLLTGALAVCLGLWVLPALAQHIIVGIDNKVYWGTDGKIINSPPGKDAVIVMDISDEMHLRPVVSLPLMNSVFGPPVNLAITPDESLALVANSLDWVPDGNSWKGVPWKRHFRDRPQVESASIDRHGQRRQAAIRNGN